MPPKKVKKQTAYGKLPSLDDDEAEEKPPSKPNGQASSPGSSTAEAAAPPPTQGPPHTLSPESAPAAPTLAPPPPPPPPSRRTKAIIFCWVASQNCLSFHSMELNLLYHFSHVSNSWVLQRFRPTKVPELWVCTIPSVTSDAWMTYRILGKQSATSEEVEAERESRTSANQSGYRHFRCCPVACGPAFSCDVCVHVCSVQVNFTARNWFDIYGRICGAALLPLRPIEEALDELAAFLTMQWTADEYGADGWLGMVDGVLNQLVDGLLPFLKLQQIELDVDWLYRRIRDVVAQSSLPADRVASFLLVLLSKLLRTRRFFATLQGNALGFLVSNALKMAQFFDQNAQHFPLPNMDFHEPVCWMMKACAREQSYCIFDVFALASVVLPFADEDVARLLTQPELRAFSTTRRIQTDDFKHSAQEIVESGYSLDVFYIVFARLAPNAAAIKSLCASSNESGIKTPEECLSRLNGLILVARMLHKRISNTNEVDETMLWSELAEVLAGLKQMDSLVAKTQTTLGRGPIHNQDSLKAAVTELEGWARKVLSLAASTPLWFPKKTCPLNQAVEPFIPFLPMFGAQKHFILPRAQAMLDTTHPPNEINRAVLAAALACWREETKESRSGYLQPPLSAEIIEEVSFSEPWKANSPAFGERRPLSTEIIEQVLLSETWKENWVVFSQQNPKNLTNVLIPFVRSAPIGFIKTLSESITRRTAKEDPDIFPYDDAIGSILDGLKRDHNESTTFFLEMWLEQMLGCFEEAFYSRQDSNHSAEEVFSSIIDGWQDRGYGKDMVFHLATWLEHSIVNHQKDSCPRHDFYRFAEEVVLALAAQGDAVGSSKLQVLQEKSRAVEHRGRRSWSFILSNSAMFGRLLSSKFGRATAGKRSVYFLPRIHHFAECLRKLHDKIDSGEVLLAQLWRPPCQHLPFNIFCLF